MLLGAFLPPTGSWEAVRSPLWCDRQDIFGFHLCINDINSRKGGGDRAVWAECRPTEGTATLGSTFCPPVLPASAGIGLLRAGPIPGTFHPLL